MIHINSCASVTETFPFRCSEFLLLKATKNLWELSYIPFLPAPLYVIDALLNHHHVLVDFDSFDVTFLTTVWLEGIKSGGSMLFVGESGEIADSLVDISRVMNDSNT